MSEVRFPDGFRVEPLRRDHPRKSFRSGQAQVDDWLATNALQNQEKHLSVTRVLLDDQARIAGYYTLATGQVDFSDLPPETVKRLPRRQLPVAVLAWLGINQAFQGQGLGRRLLAQAKTFYQRFDFQELPGHSNRLFLGTRQLEAMIEVA
jgi:GNAT superfamily N-acetyltransferase